ncbi:MAG: hypothetical protein QM758_10405 [Armatimonas sp.]
MQRTLIALGCLAVLAGAASADPISISRASLAKEARFMVTYTLAPKDGKPAVTKFAVAVSGTNGRADYKMQGLGDVRYIANDSGVYLFIPANKAAQKMTNAKGIDDALKYAFNEAVQQLKGAKKVGASKVSGQPVDIYKNPKTGTTVCLGTAPGFKLPVKMELSNEGGKRTILVSGIQLGTAIPTNYFLLPKGTQVIESKGASGAGPGLPGIK